MFRKSRKASNANGNGNGNTKNNSSTSANDHRFLQIDNTSMPSEMTTEQVTFSIGSSEPKQLNFFSRLFKRSREALPSKPAPTEATGMKKKSIWQRSKSILRAKNTFESQLQHSDSTIIGEMPIRGSGSAARLVYEDATYEHYQKNGPIFDPEAFLSQLFAENELMYAEIKRQYRRTTEAVDEQSVNNVVTEQNQCENTNTIVDDRNENTDGNLVFEVPTVSVITAVIDNPLSKVEDELLLSCSQIIQPENDDQGHYNHNHHNHQHQHFCDDPKLDSPLLPNDSGSEEDGDSLETSLRSFISGDYDLEGVQENSLDEMAEFFGLLDISDGHQPQTLPDGTLRYLINTGSDTESVESIRFHDWTIDTKLKLRPCQSETLKLQLTEISGVNNTPQQKIPGRSASVAEISTKKTEKGAWDPQVMNRRRTTVSAKISEIVAFFEGVSSNQ